MFVATRQSWPGCRCNQASLGMHMTAPQLQPFSHRILATSYTLCTSQRFGLTMTLCTRYAHCSSTHTHVRCGWHPPIGTHLHLRTDVQEPAAVLLTSSPNPAQAIHTRSQSTAEQADTAPANTWCTHSSETTYDQMQSKQLTATAAHPKHGSSRHPPPPPPHTNTLRQHTLPILTRP